jgi:uncharacterized protein YjiS (DUF1127 family)
VNTILSPYFQFVTAPAVAALSSLVLRFVGCHARRRRDEAYLSELPDYILRDIGITRSEIIASFGGRKMTRSWSSYSKGERATGLNPVS